MAKKLNLQLSLLDHCPDCGRAIPVRTNPNKRKAVRCLDCRVVWSRIMQRARRLKEKHKRSGNQKKTVARRKQSR